jgi:hypothetical protein
MRPGNERRRTPVQVRPSETLTSPLVTQSTARLDEDADRLLREAARFMEAGDSALAEALLSDDYAELVVAAGHAIVCSARARRCLSAALHIDLEQVAA